MLAPPHAFFIQAYFPKGQEGKVLARMQALRYAGMCVSSFLVTFLGNDKRQADALLHTTLVLLFCSVTTIIIFAMIRVRAAHRRSLKVPFWTWTFLASSPLPLQR